MATNGTPLFVDEASRYEEARTGSVIYLAIVVVIGIIANLLVLIVFWRYRKLRTATNLFIINLAVCDLTLSVLDSAFSIPSSLYGRWLFGRAGCIAYGFIHYFFICNTVVTLAVISIDRFFFITKPNQIPAVHWPKARIMMLIIYLYTLVFTFPPTVGWNSFVEEKYFYSGCYINYGDQTPSSIAYSVIASVSLFLVPLAVMIYCYSRIFVAVRNSTQRTISKAGPGQPGNSCAKKKFPILKRTHVQTAKMIIVNIFFFMIVWLPYVVVSLIKASSGKELISPLTSHVTVLVAKSCVIYNVLIYVILNRKLKAAFIDLVCCGKPIATCCSKGQSNNAAMRISRILSETEVPTNVAEAQRNRLSALQANDTNGSINFDVTRSSPRIRNGVVKSVEFEDEIASRISSDCYKAGQLSREGGVTFQEEHSLRRKKVSKLRRAGNGSVPDGATTLAYDAFVEETPKRGSRTENSSREGRRRALTSMEPSSSQRVLPAEPSRSVQQGRVPERPLRESISSADGVFLPAPVRESTPRNIEYQCNPAPSHLYRRSSRAGSSGGRNNPGDSGCPTSTDQESDLSSVRTRSREGSLVRRTASAARQKQGGRTRSRTSVRGATGGTATGGRYSMRRRKRRPGNDPLHTSPQELLEIQNYWKRMSLCLDDVDLDDVTKEIAIV